MNPLEHNLQSALVNPMEHKFADLFMVRVGQIDPNGQR
jgi:hypothetical protein